ncbi:MAG: transcription-repair coupling factor [Bacteroidales bacterium]|nr:transcription-repair coupling factor [Bacteroidales bacterium]
MEIKDLVLQKPRFNALVKKLRGMNASKPSVVQLKGLTGSAAATFLAPLKGAIDGIVVFILNDEEKAGYFYHDLIQIGGEGGVSFFPSGYKRSIKYGQIDPANEILRTETLSSIQAHVQRQSDPNVKTDEQSPSALLVVTFPEALAEKVAQSEEVKDAIITLHENEKVDPKFVAEVLFDRGFQRVDYVYEPGQYAVRGSILDVFSYSSEYPYRIDFFGSEIDSLRTFEVDTQLSKQRLSEITIAPSFSKDEVRGISLMEFLPAEAIIACEDVDWVCERVFQICHQELSEQLLSTEEGDLSALQKLIDADRFKTALMKFNRIDISNRSNPSNLSNPSNPSNPSNSIIEFHTTPQPEWHKNFDLISQDFQRYALKGYTLHILSDSPKQLDRIEAIFEDRGEHFKLVRIPRAIHQGFIDDDRLNCYFTDHQIFDRFHKYSLRSDRARSGKIAMSIKELMEFNIGDYIVHVDHGIAQFGGLVNIPIGKDANGNDRYQEVVKLVYKDGDLLFVSIHQLDKLSKYRGQDATPPALTRLGSGTWLHMREKTKAKMKDMARDLIALYAIRREEKGFQYSPDSQMQHELEASFMFEDTPDQLKTTQEVKRDMESPRPMDRLVCGDVGFGKTEVAIRAALKACNDCKQVAVLVPTTVLAYQHYRTFTERLKDFPVRVDYLSRARTARQTTKLLEDLALGDINIIIGTHKLIGKKVKFADLGLLIIDEEQKFGVKAKEALKAMRVNVDTLTMTATPIPRTLQFSLMGARDLSIIATPPANRYPIQTEVHRFDDAVIKEAINFELSRNGQVFVINNKIAQLPEITARIAQLVPDARIATAHGRMESSVMERLILDFANHEYDVLVCTTIVESGLDIPNANTMIVINAQNFGLSELHQLRGRVGRTNKKAFCYLITPPYSYLTQDARRRIQAIENFSGLGSGIHLAMQDLDIRGAGNLLGGEQSGFIADLGYETYQKILKQAVKELKTQEFRTLFANEAEETGNVTDECAIETDLDISFGEAYVPESGERIALYQELDNLTRQDEIDAYRKRLIDRFGKIPESGEELIRVVLLRQLGREIGFEKIILRSGRMRCLFVTSIGDDYYDMKQFDRVIDFYQKHFHISRLEDKNGKRSILISGVTSIRQAVSILKQMR